MLFFPSLAFAPKVQNLPVLIIDLAPRDLRMGIPGLTSVAKDELGIDLRQGEVVMIFTARNMKTLKIVGYDHVGSFMLVRRLAHGGFQRLVERIADNGKLSISYAELEVFFDGGKIFHRD